MATIGDAGPQVAGVQQECDRPLREFLAPPTFLGKKGENVVDWLKRYERVGRYNCWRDTECLENIEMYLGGAAAKWYAYLVATGSVPRTWHDVGGFRGLRNALLAQFTPANYERFQEDRLRDRKQGFDEPMTEYYFDVLDMCAKVNPKMSEEAKLNYLFRGLKPSVLEKLWVLKSATCKEFLREAKRYQVILAASSQQDPVFAVLEPSEEIGVLINTRLEALETAVEQMMERTNFWEF